MVTEDVINANADTHIPDLPALREAIDKDRLLLESLDPTSETYQRLQRKLTHETARLLNYEELRDQRRSTVAAEHTRRQRERQEHEPLYGGLLFLGIGTVGSYHASGSWWILLWLAILLCGLLAVLAYATDAIHRR